MQIEILFLAIRRSSFLGYALTPKVLRPSVKASEYRAGVQTLTQSSRASPIKKTSEYLSEVFLIFH